MKKLVLAILLGSLVACGKEEVNPDMGVLQTSYYIGEFETPVNSVYDRWFHMRITEDSMWISKYTTVFGGNYLVSVDSGVINFNNDTIRMKSKANTGYMQIVSFTNIAGERTEDSGKLMLKNPTSPYATPEPFHRIK